MVVLIVGVIWYLGYLPLPEEISTLTEEEEEEEIKGEYELTVTTRGRGEIEINPEKEEYREGEEVTLIATPDQDWYLNEWKGNHTGTSQETTITMDQNKEITAHFQEVSRNHTLTINIEGEGETTPEEGTHTYTEGTEITLIATPDQDWYFNKWTGDIEETKTRTTRTSINENKEMTVIFQEVEYGKEEPEETVNNYVSHVNKGEIEEASDYLIERIKKEIETQLVGTEEMQNIIEELEKREVEIDILNTRTTQNETEIEVYLYITDSEEEPEEIFRLKEEEGRWKISEDPILGFS